MLKAHDFIGEEISPLDSDELIYQKRRGLRRTLELVDEVAIVTIPDINIQPKRIPLRDTPPACTPDLCLPEQPLPVAFARSADEQELPPTFSEADIFWSRRPWFSIVKTDGIASLSIDPPFAASEMIR